MAFVCQQQWASLVSILFSPPHLFLFLLFFTIQLVLLRLLPATFCWYILICFFVYKYIYSLLHSPRHCCRIYSCCFYCALLLYAYLGFNQIFKIATRLLRNEWRFASRTFVWSVELHTYIHTHIYIYKHSYKWSLDK